MEGKLTHIYFVRHAEPNYKNHDDPTRELTEKGMRDRIRVTAFLSDKHVDAVLSSPYKRAVDTVAHFAQAQNLPIVLMNDFRERRVDGGWIEDFDAFTNRQWADFDYKLSDGETLREVQGRNVAALRNVLEDYAGKTVIIGSHGTALSAVVNYYQPKFGLADYKRIISLMPWVVHFTFSGQECIGIEEHNLFTGTALRIW